MNTIQLYSQKNLIEFSTIKNPDKKDKTSYKMVEQRAKNIYEISIRKNILYFDEGSKTFNLSIKNRFILWLKYLFQYDLFQDIQKIVKECFPMMVNYQYEERLQASSQKSKRSALERTRGLRPRENAKKQDKTLSNLPKAHVAKEKRKEEKTSGSLTPKTGEVRAKNSDPSKFAQQKMFVEALGQGSKVLMKSKEVKTELCINWNQIEKKIKEFKNIAIKRGNKAWLKQDHQDRIAELPDAVILTLSNPADILKAPISFKIAKIENKVTTTTETKVEKRAPFVLLKEARARILAQN